MVANGMMNNHTIKVSFCSIIVGKCQCMTATTMVWSESCTLFLSVARFNYRGFRVACQGEKCQMQSPLTLTNH